MKLFRYAFLLLLLTMGVLISSFTGNGGASPDEALCGNPQTVRLMAGQHIPAGTVRCLTML